MSELSLLSHVPRPYYKVFAWKSPGSKTQVCTPLCVWELAQMLNLCKLHACAACSHGGLAVQQPAKFCSSGAHRPWLIRYQPSRHSEALGSKLRSTRKQTGKHSEAVAIIAFASHHDHFAQVIGYMMACTCSTCHVWLVLSSKAMAHLLQALSALGSTRMQTRKHSEALGSRLGSTRKHTRKQSRMHSEANSEALGSRLGSAR